MPLGGKINLPAESELDRTVGAYSRQRAFSASNWTAVPAPENIDSKAAESDDGVPIVFKRLARAYRTHRDSAVLLAYTTERSAA